MMSPKSLTFYDGSKLGIPDAKDAFRWSTSTLHNYLPTLSEHIDKDQVLTSVAILLKTLNASGIANPCVTASTAAAIAGIALSTMNALVSNGCFPTYVVGRRTLIRMSDLPLLADKLQPHATPQV